MSLRARLYRWHWEARSRAAGFGMLQALRLLEESERWERGRIEALRDAKLRRVVEHAYQASPHYRVMMDAHGVKPADVRGLADLARLPVLTKDTLRTHAQALRFRDADAVGVEMGVTGGTTGNPIKLVRDLPGTVWQRASYWRGFGWGGLRLGEPFVQVFGGTLGVASARPWNRAKNWFSGKHFLAAFELGAGNAAAYLDALARSGARFIVGYTSAVYLLARHALRAGARVRLESLFPTAELLPPEWAEAMTEAFGARVLPYYGCGEVQSLGYSCPEAAAPVYHTCDEHSVIEVETPGGAAKLTGEGAFLVTDLDNHAMPLLRYRNGDAGVVEPPGCVCGRTLGRITRLDGRVNDVLYTSAGDTISGAIGPHAFRLIEGVEQYQLVQRRVGQLTLRIVRLPAYAPAVAEPKLETIFKKHLGAAAEIDFDYVADIPRTAAGKARFVISEVAPPKA
jgi:phenylacetate-CoA ligase